MCNAAVLIVKCRHSVWRVRAPRFPWISDWGGVELAQHASPLCAASFTGFLSLGAEALAQHASPLCAGYFTGFLSLGAEALAQHASPLCAGSFTGHTATYHTGSFSWVEKKTKKLRGKTVTLNKRKLGLMVLEVKCTFLFYFFVLHTSRK